MKNYSMVEMMNLNRESGQHWFSDGAMEFFNTKIEAQPIQNIFITSEYQTGDSKNKRYTLRKFNTETYDIETVGDFNKITTLHRAKKERELYLTK